MLSLYCIQSITLPFLENPTFCIMSFGLSNQQKRSILTYEDNQEKKPSQKLKYMFGYLTFDFINHVARHKTNIENKNYYQSKLILTK